MNKIPEVMKKYGTAKVTSVGKLKKVTLPRQPKQPIFAIDATVLVITGVFVTELRSGTVISRTSDDKYYRVDFRPFMNTLDILKAITSGTPLDGWYEVSQLRAVID